MPGGYTGYAPVGNNNSSWKLYLAFPNKIVIPTGAKRSGGICGAPLGLPKFWSSHANSTLPGHVEKSCNRRGTTGILRVPKNAEPDW